MVLVAVLVGSCLFATMDQGKLHAPESILENLLTTVYYILRTVLVKAFGF